jgi:hypothetical protein
MVAQANIKKRKNVARLKRRAVIGLFLLLSCAYAKKIPTYKKMAGNNNS